MTQTLNLNHHDLPTVFGTLGARVKSAFAAIRDAHDRMRRMDAVYAELAAYSDRELADLGIQRSDLDRIAREAVPAR